MIGFKLLKITTICLADYIHRRVLGFVTGFPRTLQEGGREEGRE